MEPENNRSLASKVYDGRTCEAFLNPVTIGYMYYLKLGHLVEDKIHARSIGSFMLWLLSNLLAVKVSLVVSASVKWKCGLSKLMVAAYTLQELLTVNLMM
jgi:DNA-directed RNA polymerase subunit beta